MVKLIKVIILSLGLLIFLDGRADEVQTDYPACKSLEHCQERADQGDLGAQGYLATEYGKKGDYAKAFPYYENLATHGFVPAQLILGFMYAAGFGTMQDNVKSYAWINTAIANGLPKSMWEAAMKQSDAVADSLRQNGQLEEAKNLAKDYFKKYPKLIPLETANQYNNDVIDQREILEKKQCDQYDSDKDTLKNNPGFHYFRTAACRLNLISDNNDFNDVIGRLRESAANNYPPSFFALGILFEEKYKYGSKFYGSQGTPSDLLESIKNYEKASKFGSSMAQNNLGEIYLNEFNLSDQYQTKNTWDVKDENPLIHLPDIGQAIYWLTMSAKNGNSTAQGTLSDLYRRGIGIPQDYVLAYVWQNLSIASWSRFNKQSQNELGRKISEGNQKDRDKLYSLLTEDQKTEARRLLGEYEKNYFIEPSQLDSVCNSIQVVVSSNNMDKLIKDFSEAYNKFHPADKNS